MASKVVVPCLRKNLEMFSSRYFKSLQIEYQSLMKRIQNKDGNYFWLLTANSWLEILTNFITEFKYSMYSLEEESSSL